MPPATDPPGAAPRPHEHFQTTRWSVVLRAGSADSAEALEELCAVYWRPVFGFVRRRGHDVDEARDLTQGFFASFLERRDVVGLDPERGRFRSYLLTAVRNFLANEKERARALKRGGGRLPVAIEEAAALAGPESARSPEEEFERQWALAVLGHALERLRTEQDGRGRLELFEALKPVLAGEELDGGHAGVAAALGLTTVAVKVAAHRLKKRYGELVLEEVARTVEVPQEIDDELQGLFRALGG